MVSVQINKIESFLVIICVVDNMLCFSLFGTKGDAQNVCDVCACVTVYMYMHDECMCDYVHVHMYVCVCLSV